MINHIIGLPRIGYNRDIKNVLEKCFYSENESVFLYLEELKRKILFKNWNLTIKNNISFINLGDFSYYDHILDNVFILNSFPEKYKNKSLLNKYFACAKGDSENQPMEMVKWFNTNYHYIVPEYYIKSKFSFNISFIEEDIKFSKLFNKNLKYILIGPFTLLKIGKIKDNILKNRLLFIPNIFYCYVKILNFLNKNGIKIIQIEEPIVILNISNFWLNYLNNFYSLLSSYFSNLIFVTYFEEISKNSLKFLEKIKFKSLHLEILNKNQLKYIANNNLNSEYISLGLIDGKNIWINDLEKSWYIIKEISKKKKILISTSCSFIHIPIDKNLELKNNIKKINNWISFGAQKLIELNVLSKVYENFVQNLYSFIDKNFIKNLFFIKNKKKSKLIFIKKIQNKIRNINLKDFKWREKEFYFRNKKQKNYFNFEILKTTTIGSFPQTKKIRKLRSDYDKKNINKSYYEFLIKREINYIIKKQTDYNLDILVAGEPERKDMVEYFSESLEGFFITKNGWVQSYGSRYVKPPIIYGDIYLKKYITVNWTKYCQNLTKKPVKGMLTGPITMAKWSFRRNDQPNYITCIQLSLFINKEILKLERVGIKIIQVDEPAIIEFLPIKKKHYKNYFNWSSKSFLLIYKNLTNNTQIHTHICYSNFKNILNVFKNLNIDVVSIETSRSNFQILSSINKNTPFEVGLGIYDIHTNRFMNINYSIYILKLIINNIELNKVWINPDCGLKTRKWREVDKSLINLTNSVKLLKNYFF
ncbi:MAG: 5-methyltetrahydropteroyltriglutamate--homocysteine S-methyltransferase [Candidatus Nasuia deltocephalinicola]